MRKRNCFMFLLALSLASVLILSAGEAKAAGPGFYDGLLGHWEGKADDCDGRTDVELWINTLNSDDTASIRAKFGTGSCRGSSGRAASSLQANDQAYMARLVERKNLPCIEFTPQGRSEHRYCLNGGVLEGRAPSPKVQFSVEMRKK
jgi:hypothetical protein